MTPLPIIETCPPFADAPVQRIIDLLRGAQITGLASQEAADVKAIVAQIIERVRIEGDSALVDFEATLDRAKLSPQTLRVPEDLIHAHHKAADPSFLAIIRRAIANIRAYQESILHRPSPALRRGHRELSLRVMPLDRAAVYVPGLRAIYPSTVIMTVVPAQVAGVKGLVMASPPTTQGDIHPMVLALAGELGVTEVYRLGGAQAIAALALGTERVRAVDKIVGPGNAFVAEAKRQLFGRVGIDLIAGPSEVVILADETARPDWVAADLLAQAEHDPGSAILITPSAGLARAVVEAAEAQVGRLDRAEAIQRSLKDSSAILRVPSLDDACRLADLLACEHLQIITQEDDAILSKIHNAGAIFLGPSTPVPVGDYWAGPSHVLPTGGTARFAGPLSCNDFLKACSVTRYAPDALAEDGPDIAAFARLEGLTAHARSIEIRLESPES